MSLRQPRAARVISSRLGLVEQVARIWAYRSLLVRMVRKELQVKYKNSVLGFLWSMLNPALYLAVFFVVFQIVLGSGIPRFAIFLLAGLLPWNLFSTALGSATSSITTNSPLVGKVFFPREILPLSTVGAALVHFFLQAIVLGAALIIVGVLGDHSVSLAHTTMVLPALVVLLILAAGLALGLAATNVYLRDTQHLVELLLLAWFWMTPIVYPHRLVADQLAGSSWSWVQWVNPLTTVVLTFQRGLYNVISAVGGRATVKPIAESDSDVIHILPVDMDAGWYVTHLGPLAIVAVVVLLAGLWWFGRLEGNFAEEL